MTTSQCSKSQPSSKMVSLGGRFDQLGFGSLSEDEVARVEKARTEEAADGRRRRRMSAEATARGRRRWRKERAERGEREEREREAKEGVVEREREKKEDRVRDLGKVREKI